MTKWEMVEIRHMEKSLCEGLPSARGKNAGGCALARRARKNWGRQ